MTVFRAAAVRYELIDAPTIQLILGIIWSFKERTMQQSNSYTAGITGTSEVYNIN